MKFTTLSLVSCFMALFIFASCSDDDIVDSTPLVELGVIEIPLRESVSVEGTNLILSYPTLIQDNRCPYFADCITAGSADIKLGIDQDTETEEINLTKLPYENMDSLNIAEVKDFRYTLLDVFPDASTMGSRTDSVIVIRVDLL